jgi:hypothetical protein
MNSTFTDSKGNSIAPVAFRPSTPASSNAFTSPCTAYTSRSKRRAASRIDIGPTPHNTLSSSHRLPVSTGHSNSGEAKAMRASRSARPFVIARVRNGQILERPSSCRLVIIEVHKVLSDLITTLMIARADISPPIPQEPPANVTLSVRPGNWGIAADEAKGDVLLGFPHPGFGWVGFRFAKEHPEELARQLAACAQNIRSAAPY